MDPAHLVALALAEAKRYLGVQEHPRGSNRGVEIDYFVHECGLDPVGGYSWCAAFVGQIGRQALGAAWPCPRTAGVTALTLWAQDHPPTWQRAPAVGDLFCLWEDGLTPPRFGHTGFVTAVTGVAYTTIEGNTNPGGTREGYGVFAKARRVGLRDGFIRWAAAVQP